MPITKAQLEAQNATLAAALEAVTQGKATPATEPTPEPVKRELAALHVVPDTSYGLTPEPRASGKHVVSVVSVAKDGSVVMSKNTGAPRKPIRIPVAVAEYLTTDAGREALKAQVASLA